MRLALKVLIRFLNSHWTNAPKNKKWIRGNHKPHMNKTLRKAIILRSKLKNRANKSEDTKNIKMYMQQRILVVRLNIHILATSILGESQNHSGMLANLILGTK